MRLSKIWFLSQWVILWNCMASVPAVAGDVKVIANPSIRASALSAEELKGIFLETKTSFPDGSHVEPVTLRSGAVHSAFAVQFIGKTPATLETYYRSLAFSGRGMVPKAVASDDEMVRYVANTKGAVGYVSSAAKLVGVKLVQIK